MRLVSRNRSTSAPSRRSGRGEFSCVIRPTKLVETAGHDDHHHRRGCETVAADADGVEAMRVAFGLRLYLKYGSGPRLISRTYPPQRVLCEIAAFIPLYYPTR